MDKITGRITFFVSGTLRSGEYTMLSLTSTKKGWEQRHHSLFDSGRHMNRDYLSREKYHDLVDWFRHDFRTFQIHDNVITHELWVVDDATRA